MINNNTLVLLCCLIIISPMVFTATNNKDIIRNLWVETRKELMMMNTNKDRSNRTLFRTTERCATDCKCSGGGIDHYGRFCGFRYSGCNSYGPCDEVDSCCMAHDQCVEIHGYLSCRCSILFAKCLVCSRSSLSSHSRFTWNCNTRDDAAKTMLADIMDIEPSCFNKAEQEALQASC